MARLTWKGEDDSHPDGNGPRFTTWNGVRFELGKPVDLDGTNLKDEQKAHMVKKAKGNPFFEVSGIPGRPPKDKD